MTIAGTIKNNRAYFIPYFHFLVVGGIILSIYSKGEIHLFINRYHNPAMDIFFKYWTMVGLGWLIIPAVIFLLFIRLRYAIVAVAAFLLSVIINDSIKVIAGAPRPAEYFSQLHQSLYLVPGVVVYHWNSFPSGHSATAFCLFSIVAISLHRRAVKFLCFIAAFLVAYSRMYLSEHFLADVVAGSLVGILSALACQSVAMKLKWLNRFPAIDKPIFKTK